MKAMKSVVLARTSGLALVTGLGLLAAAQALATGVEPSDLSKIRVGQSEADVRQSIGEPTRIDTYLFAPGSTWLFALKHPYPDNQEALRVVFDPQGRVTQAHMVSANVVGLER
jgi:outer membrane protein assembly factor BamE (lipoprotein component of BamABCDE complex)